MRILGINFSIDAAAALVRDGVIVAAAAEERFSRQKHDGRFPEQAIDFCLRHGGLSFDDVDAVAFFWNPGVHAETFQGRQSSGIRHHMEYLYSVPNHLLRRLDGRGVRQLDQVLHLDDGRRLTVHYLEHHLCHAASALYLSPFDEAALLTVDGYGERTATQIWHGRDRMIEPLWRQEFPHSLGSFYAAFTQYLGFKPNSGEGKVMGLASYGGDSLVSAIDSMIRLTDTGFELDLSYFAFFQPRRRRYSEKLVALLGPERHPREVPTQRQMDVAYAAQKALEKTMIHLARIARERTGSKNLAVAGGVALNCVANGRLLEDRAFERFFFVPAAGDAGAALGAALYVGHGLHGQPRAAPPNHDYHGPEYTSEQVEATLKRAGLRYVRLDDPSRHAASALAAGRIIGWFQGRMELGPRALGNRSILADPRPAGMKDLLNARVKFREPFRPFAPAVLAEACGDYFSRAEASPYMLRVY
ncbi:MAG: carbamoyltransferase, partial [Myxococcales bacterium]|nr:carbamoyltransferase [Myxococcales bacterium]